MVEPADNTLDSLRRQVDDLQAAVMAMARDNEERADADGLVAQILDGLLPEKVEGYCRLIAGIRAEADAYTPEIERLQARQATLKRSAEQLHERLHGALSAAGVDKIKAGTFTVAIQNSSPSAKITEEAAIPQTFWVEQAPKLDRKAILDALKAGELVPGAEIHRGTHLRIR